MSVYVAYDLRDAACKVRRAKYLHDGAKHVEEQLQGSFPTTSKELQKIPGGKVPPIVSTLSLNSLSLCSVAFPRSDAGA